MLQIQCHKCGKWPGECKCVHEQPAMYITPCGECAKKDEEIKRLREALENERAATDAVRKWHTDLIFQIGAAQEHDVIDLEPEDGAALDACIQNGAKALESYEKMRGWDFGKQAALAAGRKG